MEFQNIYRKNFMIDDYSFSEQSSLFVIPSGLNTIIHYSEPFYCHYSKFIIHLPPPIMNSFHKFYRSHSDERSLEQRWWNYDLRFEKKSLSSISFWIIF